MSALSTTLSCEIPARPKIKLPSGLVLDAVYRMGVYDRYRTEYWMWKCLRFQDLVFVICTCKFNWTVSILQSEALEKYCHFSCLRPQLMWIQYWSWNCSEKLKKSKRKWWKVLMFSIIYSLFSPLHFHSRDSNEFYECKVSAIGFSVEISEFMAPWGITGTDNA